MEKIIEYLQQNGQSQYSDLSEAFGKDVEFDLNRLTNQKKITCLKIGSVEIYQSEPYKGKRGLILF